MVLKRILWLVTLLTGTITAQADSVSLESGVDEQGNHSIAFASSHAIEKKQTLLLGLGTTTLPGASGTISNNYVYAGLRYQRSKTLDMTGMLEYSGRNGSFTLFSASLPVRYSGRQAYIEFSPAYRSIRLNTTNGRIIDSSGSVLGIKTGVFVGQHLRLSGSAFAYQYSRDVSKLSSVLAARFLSLDTLQLSSGLLKNLYTIEAGLDFENTALTAGKNRSISAIDNSETNYLYLSMDYYLSQTWSVGLLFGKYLDTPADQDNYLSFNVSYLYD